MARQRHKLLGLNSYVHQKSKRGAKVKCLRLYIDELSICHAANPHERSGVVYDFNCSEYLDAYTLDGDGKERAVNHLNEWGGFSRKLNMPVFTGWKDLLAYDQPSKTTKALVLSTDWANRAVGVNNQERWLRHAEQHNNGVAAFFVVTANDVDADVRKIQYIDGERVFVGQILREGVKTYIIGQPLAL